MFSRLFGGKKWVQPWLIGLSLLLLNGCSGEDETTSQSPDWPRQFEKFSFTQPNIVVFPGTCEYLGFEFDSRPPTRPEELEIHIDPGSTKVHAWQDLTGMISPGYGPDKDRGHGSVGWRICAGLGEQVNGNIRVTLKDHETYSTSVALVHRDAGDAPVPSPQNLILPLDEVYPSDARWRSDRSLIEIARRDGFVLYVDPHNGVIQRTDRWMDGDMVATQFMGDKWLIVTDLQHNNYRWFDRTSRMMVSRGTRPSFQGASGNGEIALASGNSKRLMIVGSQARYLEPLAFLSYFDFEKLDTYNLISRRPPRAPDHMNPYLVISPNGERVASLASFGSTGTNEGDPWSDERTLFNNIFDVKDPENPTVCDIDGLNPERLVSLPVFSSDSQWLAHWPSVYSAGQLGGHNYAPLVVYDAETCALRAKTFVPVPPTKHRAAVALSSEGKTFAAVSENVIHVYDVPEGVDQNMLAVSELAAIHTRVLTDDRPIQKVPDPRYENFVADTYPLRRRYILFPSVFFSPDDQFLVSANSRGVRVFDANNDFAYVETPRVDVDRLDVAGGFVRVGTIDEMGAPAGDLIYHIVTTTPRFVHQLAVFQNYLGIDADHWVYYEEGGDFARRHLLNHTIENLGDSMPVWEPPAHALAQIVVHDRYVELKK